MSLFSTIVMQNIPDQDISKKYYQGLFDLKPQFKPAARLKSRPQDPNLTEFNTIMLIYPFRMGK